MPEVLAADAAGVARAAKMLRAGGLVALATETVYGLAATALSDAAVARIYAAKARPAFNPLIVHVPDLAAAERLALFDDRARALAAAFWPGALTMVLPLRAGAGLATGVTAGLTTVALRCPAHPVMRAVLAAAGVPLAAPSANASGQVSPTCAAHVVTSLGARVDLVLDGGPCAAGIESTIVALRGHGSEELGSGELGSWELLRPGPISAEAIAEVLGKPPATGHGGIEAPGQLARHYAPGKPLRLEAQVAEKDEFMIGFGAVGGDVNLSPAGDLAEAAANLYACLHRAAAASQPRIAAALVPATGVGAAINDRLRRAAS